MTESCQEKVTPHWKSLNSDHNRDDHIHLHYLIHNSKIQFRTFIVIYSSFITNLQNGAALHHLEDLTRLVGKEKTNKRPARSWLISSLGRELHRCRRGHGFDSRTGLNFFRLLLKQCWLHNCVDHIHLHYSIHSSNIWFYIFKLIRPFTSKLPSNLSSLLRDMFMLLVLFLQYL